MIEKKAGITDDLIREYYLSIVDLKLSPVDIYHVESLNMNYKILNGLSYGMKLNISQGLLVNIMRFAVCTRLKGGEEISRDGLMHDIKLQIIRLFETCKGEF
ncbi:MAG: hypothetical protein LBT40_18145 [Deltaproteobacteria bacterium]|nr:hypothetical protein [Deltaproteobacteria bacterium]